MHKIIKELESDNSRLAKEAIYLVSDYSFKKLSLRKLTSGCNGRNKPMIKVFENVGYREEACLKKNLLVSGEYDDHVFFGLFKENLIQNKIK